MPFGRELAFTETRHEARAEATRLDTQTAGAAPAHVEHERHRLLVCRTLIEELILDEVLIDKVAHTSTDIPPHTLRIHVDLPKILDHLVLVGDVALGSRRRCSERGGIRLVVLVLL